MFFSFGVYSFAESPQAEWDRGVMLYNNGLKQYNTFDFRGAIINWEATLPIFQKFRGKEAIEAVLGNLGLAYNDIGEYHKGIEYCEKALIIAEDINDKQGKGRHFINLGNAYNALSDYKKGIGFFEKALVIIDETGDKQLKGTILGNLGSTYNDIGDYRKAVEYSEKALIIAEEIGDKNGKGRQLTNLGNAYNYLSDYVRASFFYEKALTIVEEIGDRKLKGAILGNLGLINNSLGEYQKAIEYYNKALVIAEEIGDGQGRGNHQGNLGNVYRKLGDYRNAIGFLEKARAIYEEIGNKMGIGSVSLNLGLAYSDLGDYRKAIEYYGKSLAIAEEIGDTLGVGTAYGNLGSVYRKFGHYPKAIEFYEKAQFIDEKIGNKQGLVEDIIGLGLIYSELGNYSKSIGCFEKALVVSEGIGYKRGSGEAISNLGDSYSDLGDYIKAISFFDKAFSIFKDMGDKKNIGAIINSIGNAYKDLGDYGTCVGFYEKAREIMQEIGVPYEVPEGNLADAYLSLDRDNDALSIYTRHNHPIRLGRYYLKKKDFEKAREQFNRDREEDEARKKAGFIIPRWIGLGLSNEGLKEYEDAYRWYIKVINLMEEQRDRLTATERERYFEGNEFGIPRIEAYEGAARCAFMLGKYDEAFYWAENTRGRMLAELLSKRHEGSSYKIPNNIASEEDDLTSKIMINKKQQQTAFEKNNPELLKSLEAEYPTLRAKMDSLIDRLRKDYPQYASIKYPQPVTLSQLALKKGEVIIEYEVTDPYSIGLVISDGSVIKAFKVDKTRAELESLVRKFRAPFQEGASMNEFSLNLAKDLTDLLIRPALPVLKKGEHLIIIPDESLSLLPFEALLFSAPATALKEEAILLAQNTKQSDSETIDKATIIRGLTKAPATRSRGVTIAPRVSTHILFDTGSALIKSESNKQIREIVAALASAELKNAAIQIEGHTDSVGDPKYNLKLSFKRAQAVNDALAKSGIPASRLTYTGKGDTEPVADNKDDKGKRLNRRVDFVRVDSFGAQRASSAASSSSQIKDFVYATDEYPISYYQSASVLTLQRGLNIKRSKEQAFFGLGDPVFDTKDNRASDKRAVKLVAKKAEFTSQDIAGNEETKDAGYRFSRLVNTAKEVTEVGKLFSKSRTMLGADATEAKLKAEDLSARRYVLFSTHGILGNEIPYIKQPALVLSLVGNDQEDGFLTASEIFNLNLNADIVGLSACKTGLGVQSAGEGVVGLSRAFMYAGTDTVLVSLWSVADESTYKLMVKFFDGLKKGKDKMAALKDAKNYLRNNGYDHPFYWAPFILMGEAN